VDAREVEAMARVEERHFWFRGKRALAARFLREARRAGVRGPALDLGCGTGQTLRTLLCDLPSIGVDGNAAGLAYCRRRGLARLVRGDGASVPVRDACVDLVTAFDLLEHLDDDRGALREIARVLRPGGFLLANVPAYPSLFSEHDRALGHRRRYRRGELETRAREEGFTVARSTGWGLPLVPLLAITRRFRSRGGGSDVREVPAPVNAALGLLLSIERAILRLFPFPAGLSWMVLARRP
jgi:SAM-dependent methyltransferase